ncbi:helix-turn-helix domain-containing protein [Undibacterium curvum]|uniref:Helix-turn-helix transcriptional regulator n=1 Tax=Undibacterium curvum TaxID=2762294 RepID=A0ABR7A5C5_9BURK|nr:helix-turn-helix transcriptional regulator [Undibacterium curvum]MBC3931963.1 helix-turn-helix transcriptional regulator [Undibacterium curvum]
MTPDNLRAWQSQMGYTQAGAAEALGVSLATYKDWLTGKSRTTGRPVTIDRRTALACAALVAGIPPFACNGGDD